MSIARPSATRGHIVAHVPEPVLAGASLVVDAGDTALFMRHGQCFRVIPAGSYQVPAEFAGPDVEVYFVSNQRYEGQKFGGNVGMIRLASGMIRSVFGEFSLQVTQPSLLLSHFAGMGIDDDTILRWLRSKIMGAMKESLAQHRDKGPAAPEIAATAAQQANQELSALGVAIAIGTYQAR